MGYLKELYHSTMAMADPWSSQYPLMGSPSHILTLTALYTIICLQGPRAMEGSKPRNLKRTIVVYNYLMSLFNLYIFVNVAGGLVRKGYSMTCEHLHMYRNTPDEPMWLWIGWLFVLSKFIEFIDTIFFILSKKTTHVTFLHCYHHATMAVFTWLGFKFLPGGANIIYPLINSFIHVVMYIYYGTAAIGPHMRKYLWWKKYLTVMQMSQFVIFLGQGIVNTIYGCPIPTVFKYAVYFYTTTILVLFINFYLKAYTKKHPNQSSTSSMNGNGKKKRR